MKNKKIILTLSVIFSLSLISGCDVLEQLMGSNGSNGGNSGSMTQEQLEQWAAENGYIKNPNYQQWAEQNGYVKPQEGGAVLAVLPDPWLSTNEFKTANCSITLNPDQYANNSKPMIDYLNRSDSIYIDLRDAYEGYNVGHVSGFEPISWFRLLCGDNNQLFYVDENKVYHPRYEESEYLLKNIFPENKNIFIMCQSGGRVILCLNLLSQYGYDMNKCYNIGGFNSISGNKNTLGYTIISSVKAEQTNYNFDNLTKIDYSDNGSDEDEKEDLSHLAGTYDISVWVTEENGMDILTESQIDRFEQENPGIVINASVSQQAEYNVRNMIINNYSETPDLFCYTQDSTKTLVSANALSKLSPSLADKVKERNDKNSVDSVTVNEEIYAYPIASYNGLVMYYDKSVIQESSLDSLEAIIADCETAGRYFSFDLESNSWYNISFMFATGCVSEWEVDNKGNFVGLNDTFNSDAGLKALKGMRKIGSSSCNISSANAGDFSGAIPSAVVISGVWEAENAKNILGNNYGVTDLPSFEVDGEYYHLGSFANSKMIGVKPQTDSKKEQVLHHLALYLSNEECQIERYNYVDKLNNQNWIPSNVNARKYDEFINNEAYAALIKQHEYSVPQKEIYWAWWDIAKTPSSVACKNDPIATDDELKSALVEYEKNIYNALNQ